VSRAADYINAPVTDRLKRRQENTAEHRSFCGTGNRREIAGPAFEAAPRQPGESRCFDPCGLNTLFFG
jgi:hypothetical protein